MTTRIVIKNSTVAGKVPAAGDLSNAELAINLADQKLYSKDAAGTVFEIGGGSGNIGTGPNPPGTDNETGDLWWDGDFLLVWNGGEWETIGPVTSVNGETGDVVLDLKDLNDVDIDIAGPSDGDVITWSGTEWVNAAAPAADISGSSINDLNDVDTTGVDDGDILVWNEAANEWQSTAQGTVPENTSDLTNDGADGINPFITEADVTNILDGTGGGEAYLQSGDNVSELVNDAGYITDAGVTKLVAGPNITLDPADGEGEVTISAADAPDLAINDLTDVNSPTPIAGDILSYNGNNWVNTTAPPADISGSSINQLNDVDAGGATQDQILTWDGTNWVNTDAPDIPTNTSDLVNDGNGTPGAGEVFITENEVNQLLAGNNIDGTPDATNPGYLQPGDNVSELTNDAGYITDAGVTKIVAGTNITLDPATGEGEVTINAADAAALALEDLTDVNVPNPADGDVLSYNGTNWVSAAAPPADISGSSINQLNDVNAGGAANGDILVWDNDQWVNQAAPDIPTNTSDLTNDGADGANPFISEAEVNQLLAGNNIDGTPNVGNPGYLQPGDNITELNNNAGFITDAGVTKIVAGNNVTISPTSGEGEVTINAADAPDLELNDLTDVNIPNPNPGDIVSWNGFNWVGSAAPPADISGSSINNLNDVDAADAVDGDMLIWDGTNWVATDAPTNTSDLVNDGNGDPGEVFVTEGEVNNILNGLNPDGTPDATNPGYLKPGDNVSELTNDANYITNTDTAANSDQLGGEDPDYYLNYQNFSNTPTIGDGTLSIYSADNAITPIATFTANQEGGTDVTLPSGFSGDYNDLTNKPDLSGFITDAGVTKLTAGGGISLDPTGGTGEVQVTGFSGDYGDLTNQPDLSDLGTALQPGDNVSELTNDAGYITDAGVTQLTAGAGIALNPTGGTGVVEVSSTIDSLEFAGPVDVTSATVPASVRSANALYVNTGSGTFSAEWAAVTNNATTATEAKPGDFMMKDLGSVAGDPWTWFETGTAPGTDGLWIEDSGNLYPATLTNNVGIGTDAPAAPLTVKQGTIQVTDENSITTGDIGQYGCIWSNGAALASAGYKYEVYTGGNNNRTLGLLVDPDGKVGIGTDSPQRPLHVQAAGLARVRIETEASNQNSDITFYNDTGLRGVIGYSASKGSLEFDTRSNPNSITFSTSGTTRMLMDAAGNFGIGTTTPAKELDVNGTVRATVFDLENLDPLP